MIQGSKNFSRIDTDRAIYSVFGEYHQELMEQYHVFGIDLGYRTGNYEEENLIQRLHITIRVLQIIKSREFSI